MKMRCLLDILLMEDTKKMIFMLAPNTIAFKVNPWHKNATVLVPSKKMLALHWKKLNRPRVEGYVRFELSVE